eukprot:scaffold1220_cov259-Pinguiococcus_pyrenoidosus.AAC.107
MTVAPPLVRNCANLCPALPNGRRTPPGPGRWLPEDRSTCFPFHGGSRRLGGHGVNPPALRKLAITIAISAMMGMTSLRCPSRPISPACENFRGWTPRHERRPSNLRTPSAEPEAFLI